MTTKGPLDREYKIPGSDSARSNRFEAGLNLYHDSQDDGTILTSIRGRIAEYGKHHLHDMTLETTPGDGVRQSSKPEIHTTIPPSADRWTKFFEHSPISKGPVDYAKLLDGRTRLIETGDLTHGDLGKFPDEFRKIIRQLTDKSVHPPVKYVGLEMFRQSWQADFDRYFKDPAGKDPARADGKTYKDIIDDHLKDYTGGGSQQVADWWKTIETIRKSGAQVVCVDPDVPHIWDTATHGGWKFVTDGLSGLASTEQGRSVLKDYSSSDPSVSGRARDQLMAYLKTLPWEDVGTKKELDPVKTSQELMETLDAMKAGKFDFSSLTAVDAASAQQRIYDKINDWRTERIAEKTKEMLDAGSGRMLLSAGSGHFGEAQKHEDGSTIPTVQGILRSTRPQYGALSLAFGRDTDPYAAFDEEAKRELEQEKDPGKHADRVAFLRMMSAETTSAQVAALTYGAHKAGLHERFLTKLPKGSGFDYFIGLGQ